MQTMPGRPRGTTRLGRALGLDRHPPRRASDRAEAWIRAGLLAVFLIAGPPVALDAGQWAYHAGTTGARVQAAQTHRVNALVLRPARTATERAGADGGSQVSVRARHEGAATSARPGEVVAAVMTLALMALALLAALQLTLAFVSRRRLAAWETAWSRVEPQWTGRAMTETELAFVGLHTTPVRALFLPRRALACRPRELPTKREAG
jgi:hypothetical protein